MDFGEEVEYDRECRAVGMVCEGEEGFSKRSVEG
jgi:hypothetical protein